MNVPSIWLRRIHKWVGLVIGLQFMVWAISGAAMALLDMNEVAGGKKSETSAATLPIAGRAWSNMQKALVNQPLTAVRSRSLPGLQAVQITTSDGIRLFDAANGSPIHINRTLAASIATDAHPAGIQPSTIMQLSQATLPVREHALPIWKVNFADEKHSSYYVSGRTGELLERRNDTWRWWDFFWMLHNMDYAKRISFNHPLIIMVGFAMAWLAVTGFWLLFRTMWRHDFAYLRRNR